LNEIILLDTGGKIMGSDPPYDGKIANDQNRCRFLISVYAEKNETIVCLRG